MLRKEFIDPCTISQRQLAEASSLDAGTLSRMINGGVNITVQTRRRHARKILNGLLTLGCLQSCEQAKALLRTISADDFLHEEDEEDAKLIASLKVLVDRAKLPAPPIYQTVYGTPLFGRNYDIAAICAKLRDADVRLLTLVGPAGVGKTELARQAELQCLQDFSNEPILVRLEALDDANLVMPTIARGLGLGEVGTRSSLDHLIEYLRDQHQLIILDNFEHVMEAREELVRLLVACPHLKVLVTSLEKLNVRIEHVVDVYPLAVPDPGSVSASEDLLRYPGTQLFLDRAKASRYDIDPSSRTARIIAEICKSLDGHPAAIILAAPHIKEYLPKELLQEVRGRLLQTLTGGAVDMPERHRTLEALLAYSYDQLDTQEQRLFRRLSVFAGGLTFDAAEAVCNIPGEEPLQVRKLVTSLIHRNLMVRRKARGNGAGFEVLRTYRLYGYDKLEQAEEAETIKRQHRDFFLQMAEASQAKLRGPEQVLWQGLLESELDNIRAALHWCSAKNDIETGLRLAGDLLWFCYLNGYWREGRQWLETFLKHPEALDCTAIRAKALYAAGFLAFYRGDYRDAVDYLQQAGKSQGSTLDI